MNVNLSQKKANRLQSKWRDLKHRFSCREWRDRSIVYYTGATPYVWTPESLKTGLGGSETAIIHLAKAWVKLGYRVTVYNNCGTRAGMYDGVEYRHHSQFNKYDSFDTLIIWRYPWRLYPGTKARRIWLDLHEVLLPEQVEGEKLEKYDKIFVKSAYHRSLLPEIGEDRVAIASNGVDAAYFQYSQAAKDPYKLIYASNYIRGLERMLTDGWPIIKKEIPEAHLHIYYGWQGKDSTKPEFPVWKEKMIELMNQPGVTEHGRIGVKALIQEKSTAAIHYYGCTFQEIDCISVRESASVGCVPVTTDRAALSEKSYCIKVPGNPYDSKTQEGVAYQIVELLKDRQRLAEISQRFQALAQRETWESTAELWLSNQ